MPPSLVDYLHRNREIVRELTVFVVIGVLNTALFFLTYNAFRFFLSPFRANAIAVVTGALASFWANRRFTFLVKGSSNVGRQLLEFAVVFAVTLLASTGALDLLYRVHPNPSRLAENVALGIGSILTVIARFLLLRFWVFRNVRPRARTREQERVSI